MAQTPDFDRDAPTRSDTPPAGGMSGPGPASTFVPASGTPIEAAGPGKTNVPDAPPTARPGQNAEEQVAAIVETNQRLSGEPNQGP